MCYFLPLLAVALAAAAEPSAIDRATALAIAEQRSLLIAVGHERPAAAAALAECRYVHVAGIRERSGQGLVVGRYQRGRIAEWTWFAGAIAPVAELRHSAGLSRGACDCCCPAGNCYCPPGSCPGACPMLYQVFGGGGGGCSGGR